MRTPVKLFSSVLFILSLLILVYRLIPQPDHAAARTPAGAPAPPVPRAALPPARSVAPASPRFPSLASLPSASAGVADTEGPPAANSIPAPTDATAASVPPVPWENQLDQILDDPAALDAQKVQRLASLIPSLPRESLAEAALHLSSLSTDDAYQDTAKLMLRTDLPDDAYSVLLADISERPNAVRLPLLLDIARTPNHPESSEALEDLAFYLDQDFGSDWGRWETALQAWLKANP